jgi:hypothetical protein
VSDCLLAVYRFKHAIATHFQEPPHPKAVIFGIFDQEDSWSIRFAFHLAQLLTPGF